jgi:hypothetical protein
MNTECLTSHYRINAKDRARGKPKRDCKTNCEDTTGYKHSTRGWRQLIRKSVELRLKCNVLTHVIFALMYFSHPIFLPIVVFFPHLSAFSSASWSVRIVTHSYFRSLQSVTSSTFGNVGFPPATSSRYSDIASFTGVDKSETCQYSVLLWSCTYSEMFFDIKKGKAVPLHATKALGRRGGIAPTHYRLRYWMGLMVSVTPRPRF